MARKNLQSGQALGATSFQTAPFKPTANSLVIAYVMSRRTIMTDTPVPSVEGNNLAWVQIKSYEPIGGPCITCFRAMGPSPFNGQMTITFKQAQTFCAWSIFEYDSVFSSGPNGDGAVIQAKESLGFNTNTFLLSLDNALGASANIVVGGIGLTVNRQIAPGAGFVEIDEQQAATATFQTQDRVGGSKDIDWSWNAVAGNPPLNLTAIGLEIKVAKSVAPAEPVNVEALVRRFEPILFFHPGETWFPSDAKRYVESCALWNAQKPFDVKSSWGGDSTKPFPRVPDIKKGGIAAVNGEPGMFLGFAPPDTPERTMFLELGGWKNGGGTDEPDVTAGSHNAYASRGKITSLYDSDPNLSGSKFWYHAEFFNEARLKTLLGRVTAPDLLKVLEKRKGGNPAKELALLCYYFFFPAHEESLPDVCDNVEAKEFACFGGEWACLALLLERDGPSATFTPSFVGHSGRLVVDSATSQPLPGQALDFIDDAVRVTMRVSAARWDEKISTPKVFVAKGTHSFYRDPDPVTNGYMPSSRDCGREEQQKLIAGAGIKALAPAGALLKVIGGSIMHIVSGGLVLPVGAIPGLVWGISELASTVDEVTEPAKGTDTPLNDQIAPAGAGIVVHPKTVPAQAEWAKHEPWRSGQGMTINGRRYDFLVDRGTQGWWPGDTEEGSRFNGRWGPQVENDPLGRRSGMRFPSFWMMFFLALEDGGF